LTNPAVFESVKYRLIQCSARLRSNAPASSEIAGSCSRPLDNPDLPLIAMKEKIRLDRLLVERRLFASRERAQAHIMAGKIFVEGRRIDKAGSLFPADADIRVTGPDHPYVGRGGMKLEKALDDFGLEVRHRIAMDVGASTGGFTDCLLQRGAAFVFAVDVGVGQLDWKLARHPQVCNLEKVNFRYLTLADIGTHVDLIVIDVSFISLTKILGNCLPFLVAGGDVVALIKPQFEAGPSKVQRRGVVHDADIQQQVVAEITEHAISLGLRFRAAVPSPISGKKSGNREFLLHLSKPTFH